jgi:Family of unknown function (DUF5670)
MITLLVILLLLWALGMLTSYTLGGLLHLLLLIALIVVVVRIIQGRRPIWRRAVLDVAWRRLHRRREEAHRALPEGASVRSCSAILVMDGEADGDEGAGSGSHRDSHVYASASAIGDGGGGRTRTGDPRLAKAVLYQLSYTPVDPIADERYDGRGPGGTGGRTWTWTKDLRLIRAAL